MSSCGSTMLPEHRVSVLPSTRLPPLRARRFRVDSWWQTRLDPVVSAEWARHSGLVAARGCSRFFTHSSAVRTVAGRRLAALDNDSERRHCVAQDPLPCRRRFTGTLGRPSPEASAKRHLDLVAELRGTVGYTALTGLSCTNAGQAARTARWRIGRCQKPSPSWPSVHDDHRVRFQTIPRSEFARGRSAKRSACLHVRGQFGSASATLWAAERIAQERKKAARKPLVF